MKPFWIELVDKLLEMETEEILDADFNDTLFDNARAIREASGGKLHPHHFAKWDSPYLAPAMGMTHKETVDWAYNNPELQMSAQPLPDAVEALVRLKEAGWTVNIVTATILCIDQIAELLNKYKMPFDDIIRAETKLRPHILVDDNPFTLATRKGLPTVRYPQLWNRPIMQRRNYE